MLQGSLENFSLDEVLGLLSGSEKTGRLEVSGEKGAGALLFNDGMLVGASSDRITGERTSADHMFELLRFESGNFSFVAEPTTGTEPPQELDKVLSEAKSRLDDWRQIEAVVPSLNHIVTPSADLPQDSVTINRDEWATLNIIGTGCNVSRVCDELSLDEIEGSRRVKNLAERSLVLIGAPINVGNADPAISLEMAAPAMAAEVEMDAVNEQVEHQAPLDQLQPPVAEQVIEAPEPGFGFNEVDDQPQEMAPLNMSATGEEAFLDSTGQFPSFTNEQAQAGQPSAFVGFEEQPVQEEASGGLLKRYLGGDS